MLVSIPGTAPAKEALIANSIPQTATIIRSEAQLKVEHDGEPQFKNIESTELQYAVNTATPVIRVADSNARKTSAAIVVRVVECVPEAAGASFHALFRCCRSRAGLPISTIH